MPITLKKDTWNVKDPISGNYRGAAILSTTLPEDAAQIIEDTQDALDAEEVRAGQIINDTQNAVDGIEGQSTIILESIAKAIQDGNNYELIDTAVESWLDAHPEATTTVEDHSLTYEKLVNGTLGYITPEMYGAKGDGETNDTEAIQMALNQGKPLIFGENKIYRVNSLIAPEKSIINGNNATLKSLTNNDIILTIDRDSILTNIILSGISSESVTTCGLKFSNNGYRIKLDNILIQYCDYGVLDSHGIWSVDIGKIWLKSCEHGFHIKNSASTSLSISNFLHENCGSPLYLINLSYSHIGTLYGDYANGGEEENWAYGIGHGTRNDSVYTFIGCKALFIDSIGGENNVGKYFVNIGYSNISFGQCYIVRQTSYNTTNRCLFNISSEVSYINIGPVQIYTTESEYTQYNYYYHFPYNFTYGQPQSYLLKIINGNITPTTPNKIVDLNNPLIPINGNYSLNNNEIDITNLNKFTITYERNPNYYCPIYQQITIIARNNSTNIRIIKGEVSGLIQNNSVVKGSATFTSYNPSSSDQPQELTVTITNNICNVEMPSDLRKAWIVIQNYCPETKFSYNFTTST